MKHNLSSKDSTIKDLKEDVYKGQVLFKDIEKRLYQRLAKIEVLQGEMKT